MDNGSNSASRSALVLYGSETGNAQDLAQDAANLLERLRFRVLVADLNSIELKQLVTHSITVITISTTGQGQLPSNAQKFWKSLRSARLRAGCLRLLNFSSFGLGDSSYPQFNWAHRKLYNRLVQLGATPFYECGEADEQHPDGPDSLFLPWLSGVREKLSLLFPLTTGVKPIPDDELLQPTWLVALDILPASGIQLDGRTQSQNGNGIDLCVNLLENTRITPTSYWQDVRHLIFSADDRVDYSPGDTIAISPKNFSDDVDEMISLMGWSSISDKLLGFVPNQGSNQRNSTFSHHLATMKFTLRGLLRDQLDIMSVPRRSFFATIAHFASDKHQKDRLKEFADPKLVDDLYDYTTRPRRCILEVLHDFDSVKIPWEWVAHVIPFIKQRHFSIASGGSLKLADNGTTRIELLVAIVKYRTIMHRVRRGICTRYLASLETGASLHVSLHKGAFRFTEDEVSKPVVMIGPGTGVAPMRALIHERLSSDQNSRQSLLKASDLPLRESILFFGCRQKESDNFFASEWERLATVGGLTVFVAFSRDQENKIYVQHQIKAQRRIIYEMLCVKAGIVYVCGSSGNMPKAVREALIEAFETEGHKTRDEAEVYLSLMEKSGHYRQETW